MTVIGVPYHLDEYLPDLDLTPEPAELITPELPAGEIWSRLAVLYTAVARGEPLWRVHECVFAVLALESEPVDPRL